ncbi:hypothetical protein ACFVFI_26540, partial [Streptomyces sp. NPDC057705]|uniref:hypothetical protein n=1 Tax=Streptomyces sp. NPDC057705 TaxID=3346222 RepID=UPI003674CBE7
SFNTVPGVTAPNHGTTPVGSGKVSVSNSWGGVVVQAVEPAPGRRPADQAGPAAPGHSSRNMPNSTES